MFEKIVLITATCVLILSLTLFFVIVIHDIYKNKIPSIRCSKCGKKIYTFDKFYIDKNDNIYCSKDCAKKTYVTCKKLTYEFIKKSKRKGGD